LQDLLKHEIEASLVLKRQAEEEILRSFEASPAESHDLVSCHEMHAVKHPWWVAYINKPRGSEINT
jgi:hypothetical protein